MEIKEMSKTIEDILKKMPLDKETTKSLTEHWNQALADAKIAQENNVRESLSKKYDDDLAKIHEAFGTYLEERIKPHVADLKEGVESVNKMKMKYAKQTSNIKEQAQTYINKRIGAMHQYVNKAIKSELSELHEDVVANRRATLQTITEMKNKSSVDSEKFKLKAAKVMEHFINVRVQSQLDPLREDIIAARKDNFGREIFEAFQNVFRRQHYNTSAEFGNIIKENAKLKAEKKAVIRKSVKAISESKTAAKAATLAYGKLNESVVRSKSMARLLKPLKGTQRVQMKTLLEATKTDKMDATFRKALPQIVREAKHVTNKPLRESKRPTRKMTVMTGGLKLNESDYDEFDNDLSDIRRLAGG
jgi:hypothetical protein